MGAGPRGGRGVASPGRVWKLGQGVLVHRIGVQGERAEGCGATSAVAKQGDPGQGLGRYQEL